MLFTGYNRRGHCLIIGLVFFYFSSDTTMGITSCCTEEVDLTEYSFVWFLVNISHYYVRDNGKRIAAAYVVKLKSNSHQLYDRVS